jgi:hypothetical protein
MGSRGFTYSSASKADFGWPNRSAESMMVGTPRDRPSLTVARKTLRSVSSSATPAGGSEECRRDGKLGELVGGWLYRVEVALALPMIPR